MLKSKAMKWVKALRSGKYKQGRNALLAFTPEGEASYCCLGVLARINGRPAKKLKGAGVLDSTPSTYGLASVAGTPKDANGDTRDITLRIKGKTRRFPDLAFANDNGASFKAIATWIEKNYRGL